VFAPTRTGTSGLDSRDYTRPHLESLDDDADVFVIAGHLTKCGTADEARVVAAELRARRHAGAQRRATGPRRRLQGVRRRQRTP
jgi:hypothetical protein